MTKPKLDRKRALAWRAVLSVVLLAVAVFVLTLHWGMVSASLHIARGSNPAWLAVALLCIATTFCIAAAAYGVLALHRLRYRQTLLVELAGAFVNRLLPAGLGGLGLNGVYLYRRGHTPAEATAVVSVNNLLGMAVHVVLLAGVLILAPDTARALRSPHGVMIPWGWITVLCMGVCSLLLLPAVRRRVAAFAGHMFESVHKIGVLGLVRACALSVFMTAVYTLMLFATARSVDIRLGILSVFIVFSVGKLVGSATPTPGGLVGTEAGLFAGFVAYGVLGSTAGAAVLLFRLVSYWLPLIPGLVALLAARRHKLI